MMRRLVLAMTVLVFAGAANAATLGLDEALRMAAEQSAAAVRARAAEQSAEADRAQARSLWWPTIEVVARYIARDNEIEVTDPDGAFRFPTTNQYNAEYAVTARELLFDGGRRIRRNDAARWGEEAARFGGTALIRQQQLTALDAYLSAVTARERVRVMDERAEAVRELRRIVDDLYSQGLVARNDVLQTEVRLREIEDARRAVGDAARTALLSLETAIGMPPEGRIAVADSLPALPTWGENGASSDPLERNPQWQSAMARERATENLVEVARRESWPSVVAEASHSWQQNDYLVYEHLNQIWIGLQWEVFDGGRKRAERQKATAEHMAAHRDRVELERELRVRREELVAALVRAAQEERTARLDIEAAEENYRILSDQYREGLIRSAELLDAEALLAERRLKALDTRAQHYRVYAALNVLEGNDPAKCFARGGVR